MIHCFNFCVESKETKEILDSVKCDIVGNINYIRNEIYGHCSEIYGKEILIHLSYESNQATISDTKVN